MKSSAHRFSPATPPLKFTPAGAERFAAIAALPELMAALETAEAALTGCRPNNQHLPGIRAALAKARPA